MATQSSAILKNNVWFVDSAEPKIPTGSYCFTHLDYLPENNQLYICPFLIKDEEHEIKKCSYLGISDEKYTDLITAQIKKCEIKTQKENKL